MYPNSALSAGQLAVIAIVAALSMAIWLICVFAAARESGQRRSSAGTTSLPQRLAGAEEPRTQGRLTEVGNWIARSAERVGEAGALKVAVSRLDHEKRC
jgi:hypothetical protein